MVLAAGGCGHAAKGADEIGETIKTLFLDTFLWFSLHLCWDIFSAHLTRERNVLSLVDTSFFKGRLACVLALHGRCLYFEEGETNYQIPGGTRCCQRTFSKLNSKQLLVCEFLFSFLHSIIIS